MSETYRIDIGGGVQPAVFSSLDRFRNSIGGVNGILGGLGARLASVFGVYKLVSTGLNALTDADDFGKFSQEVGIAVDQLSKFAYAADLSGAGDTFRTAMLKFAGVLAEAQVEGTKAAQMFERMGVSVKDSAGDARDFDKVLFDVSDKFAGWADGANKAAWSMELFGTRNARMTVMMNLSSQGLKAMGEEAEKLNLVITPEIAKKAEAFNDMVSNLGKMARASALSIAVELAPAITEAAGEFVKAITAADDWKTALGNVGTAAKGASLAIGVLTEAAALGVEQMLTSAAIAEAINNSPLRAGFGLIPNLLWPGKDSESIGSAIEKIFDRIGQLSEKTVNRWDRAGEKLKQLMELSDSFSKGMAAPTAGGPAGDPKPGAPPVDPGKVEEVEAAWKTDLARQNQVFDAENGHLAVLREKFRLGFGMPETWKRQEEMRLLRGEAQMIDQQVATLEKKLRVEKDLAGQAAIGRELNQLQDRRQRVGVQIEGMGSMADPASLMDQTLVAMENLQNQFGTVAQTIARAFTNTIGSAVTAVQQGIRGLIDGTMAWGAALQNIGLGIMNGIVDAISRMFAEWIVGRAMAGLAHIAWSIKEGTATVAALAPGAFMASVSSYGVAALVGAAALAAGLAAFGAFKDGGYTGGGSPDSVAGVVHGREFVMPEHVTSSWGLNAMEGIRSGAIQPGDMERSSDTQAPPTLNVEPRVSVIWAANENQVRDITETELFKGSVVKVIRQRKTEAGIG